MSYLHVDAVNQQFPAKELPPAELLILTKFAEKLSFGKFSKRIGRDTLRKITHISDPKTLRRHLLALDKKGILVCPQLYQQMSDGDEPRLFTLNYPEPFDIAVINARRNRFYGGEPFVPKFNDGEEDTIKVGDQLEPVSSNGKLTVNEGNLTSLKGNLSLSTVKIPPYNKGTNQTINNNELVVVDEEVEKFLEAAVKATGGVKSSYSGLVRNAAEARIGLDAVRYFEESVVKSVKAIRSPIGYLRNLVEKAIQGGGVTALTGEIASPKMESDTEKLVNALVNVLRKYLVREEFGLLSKEQKNLFARTAQKRFYAREGDEYLRIYFEDFLGYYRGYAFASAEELLTSLNDYIDKFMDENRNFIS